jgi:hypothetical protein
MEFCAKSAIGKLNKAAASNFLIDMQNKVFAKTETNIFGVWYAGEKFKRQRQNAGYSAHRF